jgi:hypothetical protein
MKPTPAIRFRRKLFQMLRLVKNVLTTQMDAALITQVDAALIRQMDAAHLELAANQQIHTKLCLVRNKRRVDERMCYLKAFNWKTAPSCTSA